MGIYVTETYLNSDKSVNILGMKLVDTVGLFVWKMF